MAESSSPTLVSDCRNPYTYLRPDLPPGQSAERASIFKQAVKRERPAQEDKDGSNMYRDFCNQTLVAKKLHSCVNPLLFDRNAFELAMQPFGSFVGEILRS